MAENDKRELIRKELMRAIDRSEIARAVGYDEGAEMLTKDASIIKDKAQYSVRIPILFANTAKINPKKDKFVFRLIPIELEGEMGNFEYTIQAELKRGENEKEEVQSN